jgi:hypothetical protein
MCDELSTYDPDLVEGSYSCMDRIVLNAYNPLCLTPGGFRTKWRRLWNGSDAQLDDAHLIRVAGRFGRRLHAFGKAHGIPVIDCNACHTQFPHFSIRLVELPDGGMAWACHNDLSRTPGRTLSVAARWPDSEDAQQTPWSWLWPERLQRWRKSNAQGT